MPKFDDFLAYQKWADSSINNLKLPNDWKPKDPVIDTPGLYSWTFEWILLVDAKYVRLWEHYAKMKGLQFSRRLQFAFHYGDLVGDPADYESNNPVDIRIDNHGGTAHLHLETPDHIPPKKVKGMNVEDVDMFNFLNAVVKHRSTGDSFAAILGFERLK